MLTLSWASVNLTPYFLVNRAFYEQARHVFWTHNCFWIRSKWSEYDREWAVPGRHQLRSLLLEHLRPSTVPFLKYLCVQYSHHIGIDSKDLERQELLRAVRDAAKLRLRLAKVELFDTLINCERWGEPFGDVPLIEAPSDEHRVEWFLERVRDRTWPFDADTGLPIAVSGQLLVYLVAVSYEGRYFIRKLPDRHARGRLRTRGESG
jgi:hypothetical protein